MKTLNAIQKIGKQLLLFICLTAIFSSCDSFLDIKPTDFSTPTEFYTNKTNLNAALVGIYSPLTSTPIYGSVYSIRLNCVTDEGYFRWSTAGANDDVSYNTQEYTSPTVNLFWQQCYTGIERANHLIANIGNVQNTDSITTLAVLSEAKFLRAYYHYLLVQTFGDVPLKLTPTIDAVNSNYSRTPSAEVYAQIVKDMTEAEAGLPVYTNPIYSNAASRITKTSAAGILARVCLSMAGHPLNDKSKYAEALIWAQKVKDSGLHSLLTMADTTANVINLRGTKLAYQQTLGNPAYKNNGYAQLFVNLASNKYATKESMWEIDYFIQSAAVSTNNGMLGSQIGLLASGSSDPILGAASTSCLSQQYLYNLYESTDLRRDWAIAPYENRYNPTTKVASRWFFAGPIGFPANSQSILGRSPGKWRREYEPIGEGLLVKPSWDTQFNYPVLRYADVLLMICEAEFMMNGATQIALDAINPVRRRGYGLDPNISDPTVDLTESTLTLTQIQNERSRELCFEGTRRHDLIRWGIYLDRMQEVINFNNTSGFPTSNRTRANKVCQNTIAAGTKILLWPIPSSEMLVNNSMVQNPGY